MAKETIKAKKGVTVTLETIISDKFCEIKSASIKDQLANYSYQLLQGKTKGDTLSRKGVHIVHDDMIEAFKELEVFLAHIDGAFKNADNKTTLQQLETEELLNLYEVTGFKLAGKEENKAIIIVGNKQVNEGQINLETPKIKMEGNYLYVEELSWRLSKVIDEVEQYMDGKTAPQPEQVVMSFEEEDSIDMGGAEVKHFADTEKGEE